MKQIVTFIIGLFLLGCNSINENNLNKNNIIRTVNHSTFDFSAFKIMKGKLGDIETGMTIKEAESKFNGLGKKNGFSGDFGFGPDDSPAYLYYLNGKIVFGLITKLDTDTVLFIIAAHKGLRTTNGLNPNSKVEEIKKIYPDFTVSQDLMNSWEYFQDEKNGWDFVFMTNEQTQIGQYRELEVPSKPKRLTTKTDWITIR